MAVTLKESEYNEIRMLPLSEEHQKKRCQGCNISFPIKDLKSHIHALVESSSSFTNVHVDDV